MKSLGEDFGLRYPGGEKLEARDCSERNLLVKKLSEAHDNDSFASAALADEEDGASDNLTLEDGIGLQSGIEV